jgi:hypothetical protein
MCAALCWQIAHETLRITSLKIKIYRFFCPITKSDQESKPLKYFLDSVRFRIYFVRENFFYIIYSYSSVLDLHRLHADPFPDPVFSVNVGLDPPLKMNVNLILDPG